MDTINVHVIILTFVHLVLFDIHCQVGRDRGLQRRSELTVFCTFLYFMWCAQPLPRDKSNKLVLVSSKTRACFITQCAEKY